MCLNCTFKETKTIDLHTDDLEMSLDFTSIVNGKQPVPTHSSHQPNHIRISPPAEMNLVNHNNSNGQQVHTRPSSSNSFDCDYPKPQQRMETREVVVKRFGRKVLYKYTVYF